MTTNTITADANGTAASVAVPSVLEPTTPREFDLAARARAHSAGQPIARTDARGLWAPNEVHHPVEVYVAMLDTKAGVLNLVNVHTSVRSTTPVKSLAAWLGLGPDAVENAVARQLVFATRADLYSLVAYCKASRTHATDNDRIRFGQVARVVEVAMSLPMQGRVASLTNALSDCYYLPTGASEKSLSTWASAFGLGHASTSVAMMELVKIASADRRPQDTVNTGVKTPPANPMSNSEMHALSSAAYGGRGMSAIKAHRNADRVNETYLTVLRSDATLLPRHLLSGEVTRVDVLHITSLMVTGTVSQPFVMKAGRSVNVMLPDSLGLTRAEAKITNVRTLDGDDTQLVVSLTARARHAAVLRGQKEFFIYQAGFERATAARGQRWAEKDGSHLHDVPQRDVPLDVMLAGAPE